MTWSRMQCAISINGYRAYSLVRSGDLPAMKIGGRGVWRVDRQQLEAYIERTHEETRKWAEAHPLGKDKDEV